ncbi:venom protease [Parasteatoda tepidariorum]|uniref:venom protease n=1 Tax=Parasteatoda tepidariorum TaxID=114398 RepID=UPI001C725EAE|nr:clotting factor G beta subunit [Parasteatoda tepidariorum]
MKLFVTLIVSEVVVGVFSGRALLWNSGSEKRHDQGEMQLCKRDTTCLAWYRCPPSRLPREQFHLSCFYEGYSKWDMGVCCVNPRKGPNTKIDISPNTTPSTTTSTMVIPIKLIQECGKSYATPGSKERPGNWPWMVAIRKAQRNGTEIYWCNGFLIDDSHILTAAHCFHDRNVTLYSLRIGSNDQRLGDVYHMKRLLTPESYQLNRFYSDIALVTLDRPVTTKNVMPICLPFSIFKNFTSPKATIAGWAMESPSTSSSNYLREQHGLPIISNKLCNSIYKKRIAAPFDKNFPLGITPDFICAGSPDGGKRNCGAASGGPLMIYKGSRWYAIGILIFGVERCDKFPKGYTRISSYKDFIQNNLREHNSNYFQY